MRKTTYTIYNTRLDERKIVPAQNYREALKLTGWSSRDGLVIVPWVDHELRQTRLYDKATPSAMQAEQLEPKPRR